MARVAGALGFTTMSLYRYVASKAELIDLVVDTVVGPAPEIGATPGSWRGDLERWALQWCGCFDRRPWLLQETARSARVMAPYELSWLESALGTLTATGLDSADAHDAVLLVLGHVRSVAQFSRPDVDRGASWAGITDDLVRQHSDRYPALAASTAAGAMQRQDRDRLDFGLRCILDGLENRIAGRIADGPDNVPKRRSRRLNIVSPPDLLR